MDNRYVSFKPCLINYNIFVIPHRTGLSLGISSLAFRVESQKYLSGQFWPSAIHKSDYKLFLAKPLQYYIVTLVIKEFISMPLHRIFAIYTTR